METFFSSLWAALSFALSFVLPFALAQGLALLAVAGIGIGMVSPRWLVYPYLAIFFLINSSHYGSLQMLSGSGVYSRGSGLLYFALVSWYMLGAWCCARAGAGFARQRPPACNLTPWFWGWLLLLLLHVGAALALGRKASEALAPTGFSNIVWMAPLVALLLLAFRDRAAAVALSHFIALAGLGRALFGLLRWAAFGGDPNNVYANMNAVKIRLTFFDINDSLLCAIAFAIAAVRLFQDGGARHRAARALDWLTLVATAFCIALSYRRSAWIGLLLASAVVMLRLTPQRRLQLALLGLPAMLAGLGQAALARFTGAAGQIGGVAADLQSRRFGGPNERLLELQLALADFLDKPLTGIGAWGRYTGYQRISWQTNPDGGQFLHSGVLHVALKSGLPGLLLLGGLAWAFVAFARRTLRQLPPELAGLGTAGAAGLAFMLPDLLLGSPIPQLRTTQMLALCLALPYVAFHAAQAPA